jgi:hypothetical protein
MRDIRARIAQRHGIELSNPQIQELAARRLEAILDPRTINPALLDQLRKGAADPAVQIPPGEPTPSFTFEGNALYGSHRGVLRVIRKLLNPILKLFFNPNPLIDALNTQARINTVVSAREVERDRRQAEWNALHYEILQRLVTEVSRSAVDMQALSMRVESLSAKVDFNERRVRGVEGSLHHARPSRPQEPITAASVPSETGPSEATSDQSVEGGRRRRRRRRGRRSGIPGAEGVLPTPTSLPAPQERELSPANETNDAVVESAAPTVEETPIIAADAPAPPPPSTETLEASPMPAANYGETERPAQQVESHDGLPDAASPKPSAPGSDPTDQ